MCSPIEFLRAAVTASGFTTTHPGAQGLMRAMDTTRDSEVVTFQLDGHTITVHRADGEYMIDSSKYGHMESHSVYDTVAKLTAYASEQENEVIPTVYTTAGIEYKPYVVWDTFDVVERILFDDTARSRTVAVRCGMTGGVFVDVDNGCTVVFSPTVDRGTLMGVYDRETACNPAGATPDKVEEVFVEEPVTGFMGAVTYTDSLVSA